MKINGKTIIIYLTASHSVVVPVYYHHGSNILRISRRHYKDAQMPRRIDFRITCGGHDEL